MRVYQVGRKGSREWSSPGDLAEAIKILRARLEGKGPFRLKLRGEEEWSALRGLPKTMDRLRERAKRAQVGDALWVKTQKGTIFVLRVGEVRVPAPPSSAPPQIQHLWNEIYAKWPNVVSWGICNCRRVDGSRAWSYHAWCQAWDIHADTATLIEIYRYIDSRRAHYDIVELLGPGDPNHSAHVHAAVGPERNRYVAPPCAA